MKSQSIWSRVISWVLTNIFRWNSSHERLLLGRNHQTSPTYFAATELNGIIHISSEISFHHLLPHIFLYDRHYQNHKNFNIVKLTIFYLINKHNMQSMFPCGEPCTCSSFYLVQASVHPCLATGTGWHLDPDVPASGLVKGYHSPWRHYLEYHKTWRKSYCWRGVR